MSGLLIVYGTKEGQTGRIAERMARIAQEHGVETNVLDGKAAPKDMDIDSCSGVIVAASVHTGHHESYIERFVQAHAGELNRVPSAFVSISMSASKAETLHEVEPIVEQFLQRAGWTPMRRGLFGGALMYREYNVFVRWIMKRISAREGGPTDTSKNYDLTDWSAVERFTEDFLTLLTPVAGDRPASQIA
jgi:menaquinone-dependent protoporphyrinogen oxidase